MLEALEAVRRPGGDGPRCRHRRRCDVVARQRLPLLVVSRPPPTGSMPMPPCAQPDAVGPTRAQAVTHSADPDEVRRVLLRSGRLEGAAASRAFRRCVETALTKLNDRLVRPRAHKRRRSGSASDRLKAKLDASPRTTRSPVRCEPGGSVHLDRRRQDGSMVTHPGVSACAQRRLQDALCRTYTSSPTWRPSPLAGQVRTPACVPSTTASGAGRRSTVAPSHRLPARQTFARGPTARTANTPVLDHRYGASGRPAALSPRPSAAPTDARCIAHGHQAEPDQRSTRASANAGRPGRSSDRPSPGSRHPRCISVRKPLIRGRCGWYNPG